MYGSSLGFWVLVLVFPVISWADCSVNLLIGTQSWDKQRNVRSMIHSKMFSEDGVTCTVITQIKCKVTMHSLSHIRFWLWVFESSAVKDLLCHALCVMLSADQAPSQLIHCLAWKCFPAQLGFLKNYLGVCDYSQDYCIWTRTHFWIIMFCLPI